jgi:hypothetical protein
MRLAWLSATAQSYAPHVGLAVVIVLAIEWTTHFDRGLLVAAGLVGVFAVGLVIGAGSLRITEWDASRAAERGLGARDAFTTALEFADPADDVHMLIQDRANRLVETSDPSAAIPIRADGHRLRQLGMTAAVALVIGLLPPLGSSTALSADAKSALEAEAEQVEKIAEAVAQADVDTSEEIVAELERLAQELRNAETLEQAMQSLDDVEKRLGAKLDPNFLSQKAAVQGLARDLALRPLTDGASLEAASQFEQLASSLGSLSNQELSALEDRLADLAESQAAGNPELSGQLADAARALASGDLTQAARSLTDAAEGQESGLSDARGQQALTETQRALDGVEARLSGTGQPSDGQGEGQGQTPGQDGQGQGEGQGQGDGQSQGQGGGTGGQAQDGASGQITGVAPGDGTASGQGGQGQVGGDVGQDHGTDVETSEVFSPIDEGALADLLQVGIDGGSGQGDIIGRADGPTQRGESIVPYAQVLPQYLNEAADALGELRLPPSMRSIVQAYFDLLAAQAR